MFEPFEDVVAKFQPKKLETLRPCMVSLIGKTFTWNYAGISDDNEAFPGQTRWMIAREHDAEIPDECKGRWAPEEDLEPTTK